MSQFETQSKHSAWWRTPLLLVILGVGAVAFWLLATVSLRWEQQAILGGSCIGLAFAINRLWRTSVSTLVLSLFSAFSTFRYAYYRVSETYNYLSVNWAEAHVLDLIFVFTLLGAELYAFTILFLGFFQTIRPLNRRSQPLPGDPEAWPAVDIFVPTYNEPLEVVRTTILASMNIDWPADKLNVYVLDDGRRPEFKEFAETCGCHYLIRPDNKHAKAGNINHALTKTSGEYIAIFDCDHIPTRSFLQVALGWFLKDTRLGMLQTPHHFYSPDPFERNLGIFRRVPNEGALFYGVIQDGSDFWNGTFFCGSCAVIRRSALEEIGGIAVETVTEDAHTSLRMQRRRWNTAYIRFPQAAGLATGSLGAHIGQRIRWARGMVQILRTDNPLFGKGLRLAQRLCYLNSMLHFLYAVPRLLFLTSPLVYLLLGYSNVYGYGRAILAYAIPHLALAIIANSRVQGRYRYSFWNEVYETVLAPYILLPTTIALISPKHGKFNVTSKSDRVEEEYFDWRLAAPYVVLLALNFIGIVSGVYRMVNRTGSDETLLLNVVWCVMNTIILAAAAAVARESKQRRGTVRIAANIPVTLVTSTGVEIETRTVDISRGGFSIPPSAAFVASTGEKATAVFVTQGERYAIPSIVVESSGRTARFGFGQLTLEEEEQLTRVVFGRADSWLNWHSEDTADRPLLSFLNIIGIAFQGLAGIARGTFEALRRSSSAAPEAESAPARNPALPSIIALFVGLTLASFAPVSIRAQAIDAGSASFHDSYDLNALGRKEAVLLKGSDARTTISFGVPVTKVVTQAKLVVNYRTSAALAPKSSSIDVSLNGSPVSSIQIGDTSDPESIQSADLELPADLLVADNTLTFELKGRCVPGCLGGTPATLWLKLDRSTQIHLSGSVLAIANNLRLLPAPFFDGASQRPVTAQIAFAETPDARLLEASGVVASWLGTLADFRGIHFPVAIGSMPQGNVIVLAQKNSALIPDQSLNGLSGPAIALRDNPSDAYGKVLVITGDNSGQILAAARALASGRYPREGDIAELGGIEMPAPRLLYDAPRWLSRPAESLTSEDLRVYGNGAANLYFRLPPDVSFGGRSLVPFRLNYELSHWTSDIRGEMRIKLNGEYVTTRKLSTGSEQEKRSTTVGLPVNQLFAGNTLTVEFSIEGTQVPSRIIPEQAILRDSSIDLSNLAHYVEMPRLDLFANSGFPFTKYADLSQTAIILPRDISTEQTSLYLALLGFFGARTGYPALRLSVLYPEQAASAVDKHLLIVGGASEESATALMEAGPARIERNAIRISARPDLFSFLPWRRGSDQIRLASDALATDPAPAGFISEFASPFGRNTTAVSFEALNGTQYSDLEQFFAENVHLADVHGNLALLQDKQLRSFTLKTQTYTYGNLRWDEEWRAWAKKHYLIIPALLFLVAVFLAAQLNTWLELRAKVRLQSQC